MKRRLRAAAAVAGALVLGGATPAYAQTAPAVPEDVSTLLTAVVALGLVIAIAVITATSTPQLIVGYAKRVAGAILRRVRA